MFMERYIMYIQSKKCEKYFPNRGNSISKTWREK